MLKRPKPGEDEAELLEFQRQFLAQGASPAANLVKKTPQGQTDRDVVKIQEMPAEAPSSIHEHPPVKKSRFKATRPVRETKGNPNFTVDAHLKDDVIDDHDHSRATVLTKIIEKDTRNAHFSVPAHVSLPFPAMAKLSDDKNKEPLKRKRSLFAQQFNKTSLPTPLERDSLGKDGKGDGSHVVDGSGLSATFGSREAVEIHQENLSRLTSLSPTEIAQERERLMQTLDPKLIEFLRTRKAQKSTEEQSSECVAMETESESYKSSVEKRAEDKMEPPIEVDSNWVHMGSVEHDKLAWMKDLPTPSAGHSQTGTQARFDFDGNLLPPDADIPVNLGLHHHGDEPERAGYTLEELFTLSRSSNNQQRVLALNILAKIITQAKQGCLSELVQSPVLPSILDAGVVFLLRWSLDDSVDAVMAAAVAALNALIVNHADEFALRKVIHWYHGYRVTSQAPVHHESVGIKLPGESEEKPQETDAVVIKRDVILGLVSRTNFLARLYYVLNTVRPQAPTVVACLQILTTVARHSSQTAYQLMNQKGLVDLVIKEFFPVSGAAKDIQTVGVSNVYGQAVREALSLVLTLCQAGKNMAQALLQKYGIQERLLHYILADTSVGEEHSRALRVEALNIWKVCLSYGLAETIYLDAYPKFAEELRSSLILEDVRSHDQLSALIGCLEMAVATATAQHKKHGFRRDVETMDEASVAETGPSLNWAHVTDLAQPISLIMQSQLTHIATNYQISKPSLQLCQSCLNFLTTYFICAQNQLHEGDLINCLQEMEKIFSFVIQHWNSIGLQYIRTHISAYSNIVQHLKPSSEMSSCLPDYWNSSVEEEHLVPTVRLHTTIGFIVALYRLLYHFPKIHKGLLKSGSGVSVASVIQCPDMWSYARKIVQSGSAAPSYFTKFETHLLYFFIKINMLLLTSEDFVSFDRLVLHHLSLTLITSLQYGDEYLIHDLLSTVTFSQQLCKRSSEEIAASGLKDMSVSDQPSTCLHVVSKDEAQLTSARLSEEACSCLPSVRASYMEAFADMEGAVMKSRSHFFQGNIETLTCYTSSIGESLMPQDWVYMPLIELYNQYSTVGLEVQNALSACQLDMVRNVLRWVFLLECNRTARLENVPITLKISRIMCVFLTGNDMFLDRTVHCYMEGLLRLLSTPANMRRLDLELPIPGLPSFYDLYVALLEQFEAVSFGDSLFACFLLIPVQQKHDLKYRRAIWTEYTGILRTLSLPLNELLFDMEDFLSPEETCVEIVRLYFQSVYSGKLRPTWSPVLYLVAIHHINRFMYTQDGKHTHLKATMMEKALTCSNQELSHHLVHYKNADLTQPFGMELYTELPAIRQKYIDSLKPQHS
ncbi:RNA polymerase II-associated protein 1-like [Mya arenaria]|uniref:RNA polymerase II-associated protein 1-like n=1 Tax=Mya arenaria TaxID=6604 RepID=UPI0022DFC68B|nr:RNA polymerase II-associated protein 1-like [Mya arenaria]XP_052766757.1 RNA polymerase II-associated protein 1-like [Mya arenaria]XP_052766758.1 RNA polymerase II-associated protein 1-like [Mya arenaria]